MNLLALVAVLALGLVRITPGPLREWKVPHVAERKAFKNLAGVLDGLGLPGRLPEWAGRRLAGVPLCETAGAALLPGGAAAYLALALEIPLAASQEMGSPRFLVALAVVVYLVVALQFRDLSFRVRDVGQALRDQIDDELATLQAEVVEQISSTRSLLQA